MSNKRIFPLPIKIELSFNNYWEYIYQFLIELNGIIIYIT